MSNKEFYEKILEYEEAGLPLFMPRTIDNTKFIRVNIDTRNIAISKLIYEFSTEILKKVEEKQFFTQKLLEIHLGKSNMVIMRLLYEGEYQLLKRNMTKFYIKKDWE